MRFSSLIAFLMVLVPSAVAQEFTVTATSPALGDSSVALETTVRFTFSAPLDTTARFGGDVPYHFFAISPPDSITIDSVSYSTDLTELRFHVTQTDETDFVWILTGAKSQDGEPLRPAHVLDYSTADTRGWYTVSGEVGLVALTKRGRVDDPPVITLSNRPSGGEGIGETVVEPQHVVAATLATLTEDWAIPFSIPHVRTGTYWPGVVYDHDLNGIIDPWDYGWFSGIETENGFIRIDSISVDGQDVEGLSMELVSRMSGSTESAAELPGVATLLPNYPNPFNPATTLPFRLERPARLRLTVHDLLGRRVATVAEGFYLPGEHTATWEAGALPSGLYLVRLHGETFTLSRRVLLVK